MKPVTLLFVLLIWCSHSFGQNWQATGPDDHKHISSPGMKDASVYADTLGNVFISYIDSSTGTAGYSRRIIKKETASGWVKIAEVVDTNTRSVLVMDLAGNFYFANDTVVAGGSAIYVRVFNGSSWSAVGQPYALGFGSLPYFILELDRNGVPYVLYSEMGLSVLPTVIKWDGTVWNTVGGPVNNTTFQTPLLLAFNSVNEPFVFCYDALNNNREIRKYNGSNWTVYRSNVPLFRNMQIHHDTLYGVTATDGYWGSFPYGAESYVYRLDGASWTLLCNPVNPTAVPLKASTKLVFDSSGNIYLAGGIIWKCQGSSGLMFGAQGDLVMSGIDTFYTVYASDYHAGKIRVKKRTAGIWNEEFPVSIEPFGGGTIGSFFTYYNRPYHYAFTDRNGTPMIYSSATTGFSGTLVQRVSGNWTTVPATLSTNFSDNPFMLRADTANVIHLLYAQHSTGSGTYNPLILYRRTGASWNSVGGQISNTHGFGSFVFDSNSIPYVAFIDKSTFAASRVRVKKYDGAAWADVSLGTPLVSAAASQNPVVAVDTSDQISVLYWEGTDLFVKKFDGTSWNAVGGTVATTTSIDYDLAVTESGDLVVASLGSFNGLLKPVVQRFDGTNWDTLGLPGFSTGSAEHLRLLVDRDTIYLSYTDRTLKTAVVTKYNGQHFGALGALPISKDSSSHPMLIKSGNDLYLSYASAGLFVKKLMNGVLVPLTVCNSPNPVVSNITDTSANLSWSPSASSHVGFEYAIGTTPAVTGTTITQGTAYGPTNLLPNTTYYFLIRNICGIDTSAWDTVTFTTGPLALPGVTGNNQGNIRVYPNPFSDHIQVEGIQPGQILQLTDLSGRLVRTWQSTRSNRAVYSTEGIPAGYYILRVSGSASATPIPLIKYRE